MNIFLSYASDDRELAEEIQLALVGSGHNVFFDKASLPAGGDYRARIENAVELADVFVFLISRKSITKGSYALTELKFARIKWPHPRSRILPVRLDDTPWSDIPPYLRSVTVLEPEGNVPAEVAKAVMGLMSPAIPISTDALEEDLHLGRFHVKHVSTQGVQVWIAVLGLVGVLGAALIGNWSNLFENKTAPQSSIASEPTASMNISAGIKGADPSSTDSPALNNQCPEVTFLDYSKIPPESRIVRRCEP